MRKLGTFIARKVGSLALACIVATSTMPMTACTTDQVLADINVAIQISGAIGGAVGNVSQKDGMIIAGLSATATAGIQAIKDAYDLYDRAKTSNNLQKVQAAVDAAEATYKEALAAAHVTNQATLAKVNAWANLIYTTLDAVLSALPGASTSTSGVRKMSVMLSVTPQSLKARWDSEVCAGEKACTGLVKVRGERLGIF